MLQEMKRHELTLVEVIWPKQILQDTIQVGLILVVMIPNLSLVMSPGLNLQADMILGAGMILEDMTDMIEIETKEADMTDMNGVVMMEAVMTAEITAGIPDMMDTMTVGAGMKEDMMEDDMIADMILVVDMNLGMNRDMIAAAEVISQEVDRAQENLIDLEKMSPKSLIHLGQTNTRVGQVVLNQIPTKI